MTTKTKAPAKPNDDLDGFDDFFIDPQNEVATALVKEALEAACISWWKLYREKRATGISGRSIKFYSLRGANYTAALHTELSAKLAFLNLRPELTRTEYEHAPSLHVVFKSAKPLKGAIHFPVVHGKKPARAKPAREQDITTLLDISRKRGVMAFTFTPAKFERMYKKKDETKTAFHKYATEKLASIGMIMAVGDKVILIARDFNFSPLVEHWQP